MTVKTLKNAGRAVHMVGAVVLTVYLYSGLIDSGTWTAVIRFAVIPVLGVTGIVLWQAPRVVRSLRSLGGNDRSMVASRRAVGHSINDPGT